MELVPSIDLRGGRVVRLLKGDDRERTDYGDDPREFAQRYAEAGARWLHVVDLDAAFGEQPQRALVEKLAATDGLEVELGGGLRDRSAIAWALGMGCSRAVVGSMAVKDPELFAEIAGDHPGRVVPAVEAAGGELRIGGWTERAPMTVNEFCHRLRDLPCPAVLTTDVERDGTLGGPNLELARRVAGESGLPVLLSGGVAELGDLERAARLPEVWGTIVGKALYEGVFTVEEALEACRGEKGAEVGHG